MIRDVGLPLLGEAEVDSVLRALTALLRSSNFIGYAIPSPDGRLLAILEVSPTRNVWQIMDL
jgi:hypothetical protein